MLRLRLEYPFQEPSHWVHQYQDDMVMFEVTPELVRIVEMLIMVPFVGIEIVGHLLLLVQETVSV